MQELNASALFEKNHYGFALNFLIQEEILFANANYKKQ